MGETIYHEVQSMTQPWAKVLMIGVFNTIWIILLAAYLGYIQTANPMDWQAVVVFFVTAITVSALALFLKLDVTVTEDRILIKTVLTRVIERSEIEDLELRERVYAIREYGGWGIRWWIKGIGYVVPANNGGVEIHTTGKKRGVMITSKTPEKLLEALQS